jgi:excisionase family DNA binding protein
MRSRLLKDRRPIRPSNWFDTPVSQSVRGSNVGAMTAATADTLPPRPSIQQAAAWLGVDPKTVRRYIAQGKLKAVRIGPKLIRVERESLLALAKPIGCY